MTTSMITRLKEQSPEGRLEIMQAVYEKNIAYFKKKHPQLMEVIRTIKCPYQINMTETFFDIVDSRSGETCNPPNQLHDFSELLGGWTHDTWVDLFNFRVVTPEQYPIHHEPIKQFARELMCNFPEYPVRFAQRKINLKVLSDNRRFSPPVIFLGIFHGLHIDHYLSNTDISFMLFVEPELERFEVSCYFLDYEEIRNRVGTFFITVGDNVETMPTRMFFSNYHASRHMWTRVLPGYESKHNPFFIESFKSLQTSLASVIFPIDREISGLQQAVKNLKYQYRILSKKTKLTKKSAITIVATGPSLNQEIPWLQRNQEKMIIFAVQSSAKILKDNGIKVDFIFSLETRIKKETFSALDFSRDIPAILFFKTPTDFTSHFKNVLLCPVTGKASPVIYKHFLEFVAPSTTNLAVAFALYVRPSSIYLVGCDFGFKQLDNEYASGSIYKNSDVKKESGTGRSLAKNMSQAVVRANFPETDVVQTTPFYNHARIAVEEALKNAGSPTECINLSDGAKITGTVAGRSGKIRLKKYPHKSKDLGEIIDIFSKPKKDSNWFSYKIPSSTLVDNFKKSLIAKLTLAEFSWLEFNKIIDNSIQDAKTECSENDDDCRLDIYIRFLVDLLSSWYSTVIFFDDVEKAAAAYAYGLDRIKIIIEDLEWPVENL